MISHEAAMRGRVGGLAAAASASVRTSLAERIASLLSASALSRLNWPRRKDDPPGPERFTSGAGDRSSISRRAGMLATAPRG